MNQNLAEKIHDRILKIVKEEEPYLNTDLRKVKEQISIRLDIPQKDLEDVARFYYDKTFTQWMKTYRIEKAKEILADPELEDVKVIEIAFTTGFGNLWDFNLFFKEIVEVSPSEYRAFHKNFKKVTGITPMEYKMQ